MDSKLQKHTSYLGRNAEWQIAMRYRSYWNRDISPYVTSWHPLAPEHSLALTVGVTCYVELIFGWSEPLNVHDYAALFSLYLCFWQMIYFTDWVGSAPLQGNSSFSGIWTSSHKATVCKDLSCQPLFITSLHPGQHSNHRVCVSV